MNKTPLNSSREIQTKNHIKRINKILTYVAYILPLSIFLLPVFLLLHNSASQAPALLFHKRAAPARL